MNVASGKFGKAIQISRPSRLGIAANQEAITPNGKTLYVAEYVADFWEFTATPVRLPSGKPGKPIRLPNTPFGPAMDT